MSVALPICHKSDFTAKDLVHSEENNLQLCHPTQFTVTQVLEL